MLDIIKRDANRIDFRFRDRADNEADDSVQRRLITSGAWQTVASYPARNGTDTYTTYFEEGIEQKVMESFDDVAISTSLEGLGTCPNPGFTPQNGDLVFIGGS